MGLKAACRSRPQKVRPVEMIEHFLLAQPRHRTFPRGRSDAPAVSVKLDPLLRTLPLAAIVPVRECHPTKQLPPLKGTPLTHDFEQEAST